MNYEVDGVCTIPSVKSQKDYIFVSKTETIKHVRCNPVKAKCYATQPVGNLSTGCVIS